MNRLSISRRAQIIRMLIEGASIRSVGRATRTDKNTVLKVLCEVGEFCSLFQNYSLRNLKCTRIEADEIWAFVGAKAANATQEGHGDIWTWTALCADSKLAVTWLVGERSAEAARTFMWDLAERLDKRVQLSTDRFPAYFAAVEEAFGWNGVDYATIRKVYQGGEEKGRGRYSPSPVVASVEKVEVMGKPNHRLISTSYVERQNLHMRMQMRRFTRLTNAFSKKAENHSFAVSLHFMAYNYCTPHGTLTKRHRGIQVTPAMEAGLTDHVWTIEEILEKMEPTYVLL